MGGNNGGNPATHFGRQMRKERVARGWSVHEFAQRSGISAGHASRIETGKRPPTEAVAAACDAVFPERRGWFAEYYEESRSWTPPGFKDWREHEDRAAVLRDWSPSIMTGLLQTEAYARALLETSPGATGEIVAARLANRMERQRRLFTREVQAWFVLDELSLYRCVGSPQVMAGQCQRLTDVASAPNVTMQVLPAVAHPANVSGFVVTGDAALCEHMRGSYVFTDDETVTGLERMFDTLRSECRKASESSALIREIRETWASGASPLTQTPTAVTA